MPFSGFLKKNGGCTVADSNDEHLPIMIRDIKNEHGKILWGYIKNEYHGR